MAFIRKRKTRTGVVSTALIESYRGENGPRHRVLANLHGTHTLIAALGRLAALRSRLRNERARLEPDIGPAEKFYQVMTSATLAKKVWTSEQRKEIDQLLRARKRLLRRVAKIDSQLDKIQREGVAIKKHCTTTDTEIRAEAAKWAKRLEDDEALELGKAFMLKRMRLPDLDL